MAPPPPPNGGSEMSILSTTEFTTTFNGPKHCEPKVKWYEPCKNPDPGAAADCVEYDKNV